MFAFVVRYNVPVPFEVLPTNVSMYLQLADAYIKLVHWFDELPTFIVPYAVRVCKLSDDL